MKLELFYPCKPLRINQTFGNSDPKYLQLGLKGHNGWDLMASMGQSVYATHDGNLINEPVDNYGGHGVTIVSDLMDDGFKYKTIYWHLLPSIVRPDGACKTGDLIGYADNTGFSTGSHLHFGLKKTNEFGGTLNIDNGYKGAIDPAPFFNGFYAVDATKVVSLYQQVIQLAIQLLLKLKK